MLQGAEVRTAGESTDGPAEPAPAAEEEPQEPQEPELSRKKKKKLARMSITDLKKAVKRPEVVEVHDVTSADPLTLVFLKAYRSTVPVPRHWCLKRRYLQVRGPGCTRRVALFGRSTVPLHPWTLIALCCCSGQARH